MTPPLVAVAHGSRDPSAARATEALMAEVRRQRPGLDVVGCYLDHAEPRLADVLARLDRAVVVPLLLGAAHHSRVDIPAVIAAGGAGSVVQAGVLGPDPLLLAALERRLVETGVTVGDPGTAVVLAAAGSADESAVDDVSRLAQRWAAGGWW
ncbi:MAG: sirohydrochlorin chelatase, partial [Actinomycetes bacterium]